MSGLNSYELHIHIDQLISEAKKRGFFEAVELLRSEEASRYSFDRYDYTKCSKNDAHITRGEWACWLEDQWTLKQGDMNQKVVDDDSSLRAKKRIKAHT